MPPELVAFLASCNRDPVRFVYGAFDWSLPALAGKEPDPWQLNLLRQVAAGLLTPNEAIKIARASGHGIGKSAVVAWIILWAFSTAPDTRGVITANTEPQLKTKTWAELGVWFNRFIAREFFKLEATALMSRDRARERTWRIDAIPWTEKNPEAFAGLHNLGKRVLLIFDEASSIADVIWDTAEGALTDDNTEILWLVFGNPTRNTGRFRECFSRTGNGLGWRSAQIDSRTVRITNKTQIDRWAEIHGDDSDFFRVRVKGEFPRTGAVEFISAAAVDAAMEREAVTDRTAPLALGVDVARFGTNATVLFPRKGRDARSVPALRYSGLTTVEVANRVSDFATNHRPDGIFIDGGGVGGGVVDNVRNLRIHCWDIQFGGKDDGAYAASVGITGERYGNKRAAIWGAMRAWINSGGCLPRDEELKRQLLAPQYYLNRSDAIILESKDEIQRRLGYSPDDADALALTFAAPLQPHLNADDERPRRREVVTEYDPFSDESIYA